MKSKIKNKNGNVVIVAMIFVGIALVIMMLIIAIFMSSINSVLHGVKTDMYTINKSAILAVNKNRANVDDFSYNEREYKKYFSEMLKKNYNLNDDFKNENGLITKIQIEEYKIYEKGKKDGYNDNKCDDRTIHTVLKVKMKPIILSSLLEEIFTFTIHEDVNMNMVQTKL